MSSNNRQPIFPVLMVAAGVVLILGSVFWIMNASPTEPAAGSPQVVRTVDPVLDEIPTQGASARIPYPNVERITTAEAKAAFDAKSAVFIDTRGQMYFDSSHIPGAIPMTDNDAPSVMPTLDRGAFIILYCT